MDGEKFFFPIMVAGAIAGIIAYISKGSSITPSSPKFLTNSPITGLDPLLVPQDPFTQGPVTPGQINTPNYLTYNLPQQQTIAPLPPPSDCCCCGPSDPCSGNCNTNVTFVDGNGTCMSNELAIGGAGFDYQSVPLPQPA